MNFYLKFYIFLLDAVCRQNKIKFSEQQIKIFKVVEEIIFSNIWKCKHDQENDIGLMKMLELHLFGATFRLILNAFHWVALSETETIYLHIIIAYTIHKNTLTQTYTNKAHCYNRTAHGSAQTIYFLIFVFNSPSLFTCRLFKYHSAAKWNHMWWWIKIIFLCDDVADDIGEIWMGIESYWECDVFCFQNFFCSNITTSPSLRWFCLHAAIAM